MSTPDTLLDALGASPEVRPNTAAALVATHDAQVLNEAADWLAEVGESNAAYLLRTVDMPRRMAAAGQAPAPETSYPPALPWAAKLDADDLEGMLADLADAAGGDDDLNTLAEVEAAIARWRAIGEATEGLRSAPGPDDEHGTIEDAYSASELYEMDRDAEFAQDAIDDAANTAAVEAEGGAQ